MKQKRISILPNNYSNLDKFQDPIKKYLKISYDFGIAPITNGVRVKINGKLPAYSIWTQSVALFTGAHLITGSPNYCTLQFYDDVSAAYYGIGSFAPPATNTVARATNGGFYIPSDKDLYLLCDGGSGDLDAGYISIYIEYVDMAEPRKNII